jgi:hypothetical protein
LTAHRSRPQALAGGGTSITGGGPAVVVLTIEAVEPATVVDAAGWLSESEGHP